MIEVQQNIPAWLSEKVQQYSGDAIKMVASYDQDVATMIFTGLNDLEKQSLFSHGLGFSNMALLGVLMQAPIPESLTSLTKYEDLNQIVGLFNAYFINEKYSDDTAGLDPNGEFLYPKTVTGFNELATGIIGLIIDPTDTDSEEATRRVDALISDVDNLPHLDMPSEVATLLEGNPASINATMLKCNLKSLANLVSELHLRALRSTPESVQQGLYNSAIQALKDRYTASNEVITRLNMSIDEAIEVGSKTILTDCFMGLFAAYLDTDSSKDTALDTNGEIFETIKNATAAHTMMIRLVNDGGSLMTIDDNDFTNVMGQLKYAARISEEQMLSPLHTIKKLSDPEGTNTANPEEPGNNLRNILSRLIKDAVEGEYNMALFAGIDSNTDTAAQWDQLVHNLIAMRNEYAMQQITLTKSLVEIRGLTPAIASFLELFVEFNKITYARVDGDYDRAFKLDEYLGIILGIRPTL